MPSILNRSAILLLLGFFFLYEGWLYAQFAQESVLGQGTWYKIAIEQNGLYRIGRQELISAGIPVENIDPRSLRLYTQSSGMLPQANAAPRIDDLSEVAIRVVGEEDGRFDANDFILFYGEGASKVYFHPDSQRILYEQHLYERYNYYFLTYGGPSTGKRIQTAPIPSGTANDITTYDFFFHHEKDEQNILRSEFGAGSGREWYGEVFNVTRSYTYNYELRDLAGPITLRIAAASNGTSPSELLIQANGNPIGSLVFQPISGFRYDFRARESQATFSIPTSVLGSGGQLRLQLQYNSGFRAYLNYFQLHAQRQLRLYQNNEILIFQNTSSRQHTLNRYRIEGVNPQSIEVWDISHPHDVQRVQIQLQGNTAYFLAEGDGQVRQFVAWQGSPFLQVSAIKAIPNQNLHALPPPELLIISHPDFMEAAERLADHHRSHDHMQVLVVSTEAVYNEFSGGKQDPTALRDFVRMLYQKDTQQLRYLLLMGNGSYDYRHILSHLPFQSFVPTYQSRQSLHPVYSYSSDDYFGFLEEHEGEWQESIIYTPAFDHSLDIGIGRIPCNTPNEAHQVVDKIIRYVTHPDMLGDWRQRLLFVGDDGDFNQHQVDADQLASYIESHYPQFMVSRLLLDAYPHEVSPSGKQAPLARQSLQSQLEKGVLIVNYSGHGSEFGWAQEGLLNFSDIRNRWNWQNHYPFLVTATCEFGRFDDPNLRTAAEEAILRSKGGAIGLLTTTRPVYASTNFLLNQKLVETLFEPLDDGQMPRLGDIYRITKNGSLAGVVNRNFCLLGDPAMRLAYAEHHIEIERINGVDFADFIQNDRLAALQLVSLEGRLHDEQQNTLNLNGTLTMRLYDKPIQRSTLGNPGNVPMSFYSYDNLLFQGQVSVVDGRFQLQFVVPRGINYHQGAGKLSLYAFSPYASTDAATGNNAIMIGGTSNQPIHDQTPPQLQLFLNDTTFRSGDHVLPNVLVYARLTDESGINLTNNGSGQVLSLILDDSIFIPVNHYYLADKDNHRSGSLRYPLQNLAVGWHTLRLLAWDTHLNPAEASIHFFVSETSEPYIQQVSVYPNPSTQYIQFEILHNRAGEALQVDIDVFDSFGRPVAQWYAQIGQATTRWQTPPFRVQALPPGVYIYRLSLRGQTEKVAKPKHGKFLKID